ncbi:MAG TPA: heme-binding protein [Candidatus Acidoferrales bacterium]|jgi:glc operon protein GlcG|nr:heme-binding protein [Candidatus Acidoferrales bacterium]
MALVTRDHPKLTLEGARAVLAAAQRRAEEIRVPMNLAVVDDGAHLLAFERMDGAKPASIAISLVKAQAAALRRAATGPAMAGDQVNVSTALGLAIANPAQQTPIRGGVPLVVDDQVIGAVGASAGTEDQDLDVARAGAAAIEKA